MDQVTKVKRHLKQEQWKALINDCQSSKMTVAAWCKVNGICEQTYYRNLKRLREQLCEIISIPSESLENPTTFKKIEITSPLPSTNPSTNAGVIIHLQNATVEIYEGTCMQTIQTVLAALKSVC